MHDFTRLFSKSLERAITPDPGRFFARFYETFIPTSPEITALFEGVDMTRQKKILEASLAYMSEFAAFRTTNEYLERLGELHSRREVDIAPPLYDVWLDALVDTVRELDPEYTDEVGIAWRVIMAPGIAFMRAVY